MRVPHLPLCHGSRAAATQFFQAFKPSSEAWKRFVGCRQLERRPVSEDDFVMFRTIGVGGFGAVNVAMKKVTSSHVTESLSLEHYLRPRCAAGYGQTVRDQADEQEVD